MDTKSTFIDSSGRKRTVFTIDLGGTEEALLLANNLDKYIALSGKTKKWFFLEGAAQIISKDSGGEQLIAQIAEYLIGVGSRRGRPSK